MTDTTLLRSVLSDAELILATRGGDGDAYGELYRRHLPAAQAAARALTRSKADGDDVVAEAFSRVLSVIQRGGGPEVSFRPYLLTTVRNSFYERARRTRLEDPTDTPDDAVNLAVLDLAASDADRAMIAEAFASLPERWQLVLWHTEVEGRSAAEVAPLLGIAANAVAALAYRAREGLREAYLQSHLQQPLETACQACVANLGAYVRDGLPARERRKVDEHLASCSTCPPLLAELNETNTNLRAVLIPLIVGVPAAKYLAGLGLSKGLASSIRRMPRSQQAGVVGVAAAAVFALILAGVAAGRDDHRTIVAAEAPAEPSATTLFVTPTTADASTGTTAETRDTIAADEMTTTVPPTDTTIFTPDSSDIYVEPTVEYPTVPYIPVTTSPRTTPTTRYTPPTRPPTTTTTPQTSATNSQATYPTVVPGTDTTTTTVESTTSSSTTTTTAPPSPAQPQVGVEPVKRAYGAGSTVVRINARNGAGGGGGSHRRPMALSDATNLTVTLPNLPSGVGFVGVDNSDWNCWITVDPSGTTGTLNCQLPDLPENATTSADITLSLASSVTALSLQPTISADGASYTAASPLAVPVTQVTDAITVVQDTGDIITIGNSSMTCDVAASGCATARDAPVPTGASGSLNRQSYPIVGVGSSTGVLNASSATLTIPADATVSAAYLVWSGRSPATPAPPTAQDRATVTVGSGAAVTVTADAVTTLAASANTFSAWADVTELISTQSGTVDVTVSNLAFANMTGGFGGWSLIVLTHDSTQPERLLVVTLPNVSFQYTNPVSAFNASVAANGLASATTARVSVVSVEGDRGNVGDQLTVGNNSSIPNAFSSSVAGTRSPSSANNFGFDLGVFSTEMPASVDATTDRTLTVSASVPTNVSDDLVRIVAVTYAIDLTVG